MSLRNIHKRTERGESPVTKVVSKISALVGSAKLPGGRTERGHSPQVPSRPLMSHEKRLIIPRKADGRQGLKNDRVIILVIAVIAIAVIAFELSVWGSNKAPVAQKPVNNTINNTLNGTNQTPIIIVEKPDIAVKTLSLSKDAVLTGEPVEIVAVFENIGKSNATDVALQLYASNVLLKEEVIENFTAGESHSISVNWTPKETEIGQRIIRASADPKNKVDEASESNNEKTKNVEVELNIILDVSDKFKFRTSFGVGDRWYSDKYGLPPNADTAMTYFQLYQATPGTYLLDIGIAGFKADKTGVDIYAISVPDASIDGWNGGNCIKEQQEGADCVWTGPEIAITLSISKGELIATDASSVKSRASTSGKRIGDIELAGMTVANWPDEELRTFKILNIQEPNKLVPDDFYEIVGNKVFVHPMRWNPTTGLGTKVATTYSFRITVN